MYTYCLFCDTVRCQLVANVLMQRMPCRAFSPKQVQHTWSKGKMVDIVHDLLPGYVFLYLEDEPLDISVLHTVQGVIKCLCSSESTEENAAGKKYELAGADEQFALMLLQKDGVIGKTKVYEEGQLIRICQGAFQGVETKILRVNRRNMRMQIEIPFAGRPVRTWVEYEVVESVEKDGPVIAAE